MAIITLHRWRLQALVTLVCATLVVVEGFFSADLAATGFIQTKGRWPTLDLRHARPSTLRLAPSDDDNNKKKTGPRVRFSETDGSTMDNPLDSVLSLLTSDIGSIALGVAGIIVLVVGRSLLDADSLVESNALGQETRSNLLAVFACGAVLVNGISKLDVESALAESVTMSGVQMDTWVANDAAQKEITWVLESVLAATPAKSSVLLRSTENGNWQVQAGAGVLPSNPQELVVPNSSPILDRFRSNTQKETYLPTLQALPGKTELSYFPVNTQSVLLLPISTGEDSTTVLALGSNQARSFTPKDIAWGQTVASRLGVDLVQ